MKRHEALSLRQFLSNRWALCVSILLCAFIFFQTIKVVSKGASTDSEISELKDVREKMLDEQKKLEQIQKFLLTDYFAESEARTKFGYKKSNETAVIISKNTEMPIQFENASETREVDVSTGEHNKARGRYAVLWWDYFFGTKRK